MKFIPYAIITCFSAIIILFPLSAHAVEPVKPKESHRSYLDVVINASVTSGQKSVVGIGPVVEYSLSPSRVVPGEGGGWDGSTPNDYIHLQASLGTYGAFDDLSFLGSIGVIHRLASPYINKVGLLAVGGTPRDRLGPVARAELLHNLGLQLGWMFSLDDNDNDGVFISVDFGYLLFNSLGLL